jgi:hypothetical protein
MYQSPVSKQKVHTLVECIMLDKKPTAQQEREMFAIANDCVYIEDCY